MKKRRDAPAVARLRRNGPAVAIAAAVLGALVWSAASSGAGHAGRPLPVRQTAAQAAPDRAPQTQKPLPAPLWLQVEADATRTTPADPAALRALLDPTPVAGALLPTLEGNAASPLPDWFAWGRLSARRARAVSRFTSSMQAARAPETALGVYAAHSEAGTTLCMVNRTGEEARVRVRVRLPQGIYRIERLTLSPAIAGDPLLRATPDSGGASTQGDPRPAPGNTVFPPAAPQTGAVVSGATPAAGLMEPAGARLDRLGGRDLPGRGGIVSWVALAPGQICLLRYTDSGREARAALFDALARLHALALSAPGPARSIRRILEEGEPYLDGAVPGASRHLDKHIACIHRLLLLTAQARSLARNDQAIGAVPVRSGRAVQQALDHLAEALAETSANLLGLVPGVTLTPQETASTTQARPAVLTAQEASAPRVVTVAVTLANNGPQSVSLVKLGLDGAALPAGVVCRPADPAFFGALPPGQSVRAAFHLRVPAQTDLPGRACIGDISYFMAGAPAHLRLHPW